MRMPRSTTTITRWFFLALTTAAVGCGGADDEPDSCGVQLPSAIPDGGAPAGPIAATMNDVSILFPLPQSHGEVAQLLSASACGARGQLLPSALFLNPDPITGTTGQLPPPALYDPPTVASYKSLRVVAMRIDPCFGSSDADPRGEGCTAQLRLVLQEIIPDGVSVTTPFDTATHLFYELSRDEFLRLAQALVALRQANQAGVTMGPLAPHPLIVGQGLSGPMSQGVKRLILQYAGEANLVRMAQLRFGLGAEGWSLSVRQVRDARHAVTSPLPIATLPAPDGGVTGVTNSQSVTSTQTTTTTTNQWSATVTPPTTSVDDFSPLFGGTPASLDAATQQAAFDALVRIENPADHTVNNIDCASCHLAAPTVQRVTAPLLALDDQTSAWAFRPDGQSVTADDLTPTFGGAPGDALNLHAFSYLNDAPTISQRVVNETAAIVEYLNQLP